MFIINADDFGRNETATDNIIKCFEEGVVACVSAMVFMADSARAAELALNKKIDAGLHLNLDAPLTGSGISKAARENQEKVGSYLHMAKISQAIFNPFLRARFADAFKWQWDEFERIYGRFPGRIDGHHHYHLCMNILVDHIIPEGLFVRRNFSFARGEKNAFNILYRDIVDHFLEKRYRCTDFFYALAVPPQGKNPLQKIIDRSTNSNVELMTHPEKTDNFEYLLTDEFKQAIAGARKGCFLDLT